MKKIKNYLSKLLTSLRICIFGPVVTSVSYKDNIMTVMWETGDRTQYERSGTVWYRLPWMRRASPDSEKWLSEIQAYIQKWGNDYPTAHLNERNNL